MLSIIEKMRNKNLSRELSYQSLIDFGKTSRVLSKAAFWSRVLVSPSPVCVVEVVCVTDNAEGVVEVILDDTPSSSIR
jgi:hypothetical protein